MNGSDFGVSCDSLPLGKKGEEVGGLMGDISNTTGGGWIAVGVVRSDGDRGDGKGGLMQGLGVSILNVGTGFLFTLVTR